MATISLRSTKELTDYVKTCDRLRAIAVQIEALQQTEERLRPAVLTQIRESGESRAVIVRGAPRILKVIVDESVRLDKDKEETVVDAARKAGVKVSTRTPDYVHPATLAAAYRRGLLVDFVNVVTTERVEVT
jgi:hypothetical protein